MKNLNAVVQRAASRIEELNRDLANTVEDATSLANALVGLASHIHDDICPVCERDFSERDAGPLSAHVAAKIASLTSEAGRLQDLATERAEENSRLIVARRDLLGAGDEQLSVEDLAEFTVRRAQMAELAQILHSLEATAGQGRQLRSDAVAARQALVIARRRDELSVSMLPEIEAIVQSTLSQPASKYANISEALGEAIRLMDTRIADAELIVALRIDVLSELDRYIRELARIDTLRADRERDATLMKSAEVTLKKVEAGLQQAKTVSRAANSVRSEIVKKVFGTSLNKTWRDLFVRLAPSEQFVPAFKLPIDQGGGVEAVLETLHRSGKASGSPGAMLSQGNLNTAALTLFLALHLSVPVRIPWLVLDDPVQSMDDVHVAQFAALLRSLSKGMNRQVIIAVHDRAMFDYLTLELSPAFPGDSLLTVELDRSIAGNAQAVPRAFSFEEDLVIAA